MNDKIVLNATDLDGYLTEGDKANIDKIDTMYQKCLKQCEILDSDASNEDKKTAANNLRGFSTAIGDELEKMTTENGRIHCYSFETPKEQHGEASRVISKLRNPKTGHDEFLYYNQRAFELLFGLAYADKALNRKRMIITETPVTLPVKNFAVHLIPDVDELINNTVMCVMLRGALLPSMIMSKEIQEYSSTGYITPFALFRIKRDESKQEKNMAYVLDLSSSFFDLEQLNGKDLVFADPMNATGGSMITIANFLRDNGVKPRSIKCFNVIATLKGALRITRAIPDCEVYTLWMDPTMNANAYIMPGLGDAGDRLNGVDGPKFRGMLQLVADYGTTIINLYRAQVREIENTVMKKG